LGVCFLTFREAEYIVPRKARHIVLFAKQTIYRIGVSRYITRRPQTAQHPALTELFI
jgi:hypothetical protein